MNDLNKNLAAVQHGFSNVNWDNVKQEVGNRFNDREHLEAQSSRSLEEEEAEFDFKQLILNLIYDDQVIILKRVLGLGATSRRSKNNNSRVIEDLHELNCDAVDEKDTYDYQVLPLGHELHSMNWHEEHSKTNLD